MTQYLYQAVIRARKLDFPSTHVASGTFETIVEAKAWALELVFAQMANGRGQGTVTHNPTLAKRTPRIPVSAAYGLGKFVWEVHIVDMSVPGDPTQPELFPGANLPGHIDIETLVYGSVGEKV